MVEYSFEGGEGGGGVLVMEVKALNVENAAELLLDL